MKFVTTKIDAIKTGLHAGESSVSESDSISDSVPYSFSSTKESQNQMPPNPEEPNAIAAEATAKPKIQGKMIRNVCHFHFFSSRSFSPRQTDNQS